MGNLGVHMGTIQITVYLVSLLILTKIVGTYMARVFNHEKTMLDPILRPVERGIYKLCGVDEQREMRWTTYTLTMLTVSAVCVVVLYILLRMQDVLPLNYTNVKAMSPFLAFNTAVSFVTNTNWQAYAGEHDVSYLIQMIGFTWQNYVSAAVGIAMVVAFIRAVARQSLDTIGNFWVDLTRACLWVLLPFSVLLSVVFASQGVIQNLNHNITLSTLEGHQQTIIQGPIASQEAVKLLGTNGGGFTNANSAHPFENPTPLTNFLQMLAIFLIPSALTYTFGRMIGDTKQGWTLFAVMTILFLLGVAGIHWAEQSNNPLMPTHVDQTTSIYQSGGNMEGKEVRFGITGSSLYSAITTDASCGAVNSMLDSYTPLGGGIAMLNIMLGELIFGGVGSGLLGMIIFVIMAVFIAGLMVGRTPEYLGKKIEPKEMKMAMLTILIVAASILFTSAIASVTPLGLGARANMGPHGLSEILYAATSASGNNGSAFGGLNASTPFYCTALGLAMLCGRYLYMVPIMAIAGSLARKKKVPQSSGTLPTTGWLFVSLLVVVIIIVGALTFMPAIALGPIVEHLLMQSGHVF